MIVTTLRSQVELAVKHGLSTASYEEAFGGGRLGVWGDFMRPGRLS
jgi:hypothetical protein